MPSITIRGNNSNSAGIFAIFSWSIFSVVQPNERPAIKGNTKSITVRM